MVSPISLVKMCSKSPCKLRMKEILEIIECSQIRFRNLIDDCSKVYEMY